MITVILAFVVILMCSNYFRSLKASLKLGASKLLFHGNLKQVYLVRTDLDMGKGKIAAQCCHAAVKAYRDLSSMSGGAADALRRWEREGSRKVVVKVSSEEELTSIINGARLKGLYATTIRDAGKTQVAAFSMTVGVVGPANDKEIDEISGHLKLL